jgi:hypothetical protein
MVAEVPQVIPIFRNSGKEPRHEIHCTHGHANPKDNSCEGAFGPAFPEGEHEPTYDDRDQGQTGRDGARKGGLQGLDRLGPRVGRLCENLVGQSQTSGKGEAASPESSAFTCLGVTRTVQLRVGHERNLRKESESKFSPTFRGRANAGGNELSTFVFCASVRRQESKSFGHRVFPALSAFLGLQAGENFSLLPNLS